MSLPNLVIEIFFSLGLGSSIFSLSIILSEVFQSLRKEIADVSMVEIEMSCVLVQVNINVKVLNHVVIAQAMNAVVLTTKLQSLGSSKSARHPEINTRPQTDPNSVSITSIHGSFSQTQAFRSLAAFSRLAAFGGLSRF